MSDPPGDESNDDESGEHEALGGTQPPRHVRIATAMTAIDGCDLLPW